jgi:peptidoglycan hydrolase-like protein with peptidoglycan-binding domain
MRVSAAIAASIVLLASAAYGQSADSGHRFAPDLAPIFIADIQRQLGERGYYSGPADGRMNAAAQAAITAYQHDIGLPMDGIADLTVINMLNFGPQIVASQNHHSEQVAAAAKVDVKLTETPPPPPSTSAPSAKSADSDGPPRPLAAPRPAVSISPLSRPTTRAF